MLAAPPAAVRRPPSRGLAGQHAPPLDLPFRFFLTALAALALLVVLVFPQNAALLGSFANPTLIAFVHLNTLAVIAAMIMGASCQLLPVVLQAPLASVRLARLCWWLLTPGVAAFALGLAGGWLPLLGLGGALVVAAAWLYAGMVAATLRGAAERDVVAWHIAVADAGLAAGAGLGLLLALTTTTGLFGGRTFAVLGAHVALMLGGWVTPMLTGVAYRLIGMFTLSEDRIVPALAWAELGGTAGGAWLLALATLFAWPVAFQAAGALALLLGLALFAAQALRMYAGRRRRTPDVHIPFVLVALACGLAAAGLVLAGVVTRQPAQGALWRLAGWLAIAGWAETAIQGFLYKIGAFLTWLHRYAPLAGRRRVPRLEELYSLRLARAHWALWSLGVLLQAAAIASGSTLAARVAAAALALGLVACLANAARVGAHWRAAAVAGDARRPAPPPVASTGRSA